MFDTEALSLKIQVTRQAVQIANDFAKARSWRWSQEALAAQRHVDETFGEVIAEATDLAQQAEEAGVPMALFLMASTQICAAARVARPDDDDRMEPAVWRSVDRALEGIETRISDIQNMDWTRA